jgi:hypothetical protein
MVGPMSIGLLTGIVRMPSIYMNVAKHSHHHYVLLVPTFWRSFNFVAVHNVTVHSLLNFEVDLGAVIDSDVNLEPRKLVNLTAIRHRMLSFSWRPRRASEVSMSRRAHRHCLGLGPYIGSRNLRSMNIYKPQFWKLHHIYW